MREIASVEIHALVKELQNIVGSHLKKFYDLGDGSFRISFSLSGANQMVYIKLLHAINRTSLIEEAEEPTNFAMAVRKRLVDQRVKSIAQHGSDRIVVFDFFGEEGYRLIIEMFGKGNVVLVDKDYKIILAYRLARYKEREVVPKRIYRFPESNQVSFSGLSLNGVREILGGVKTKDEKLIRALSECIDIGPLYLEDVLLRSGLDPKSNAKELSDPNTLAENMIDLFKHLDHPQPRMYVDADKRVDYSIVPLKKYERYSTVECDSVSGMFDALYASERSRLEKDQTQLKEIEMSIEKQKRLLEELQGTEKSYNLIGNRLLENMGEINQMIEYINKKRRVTLEELQASFRIKVRSLDLKKKSVVIEL